MRKIAQDIDMLYCFQAMDFLAIKEASEAYIVDLFGEFNVCNIHAKRDIIQPKNILFACRIRG